MAYTLQQIFEALGKVENGGSMVADLQTEISKVRSEAANIAGKGTSTTLYEALKTNDCEAFVKEVQRKLRKSPQREKAIRDGY